MDVFGFLSGSATTAAAGLLLLFICFVAVAFSRYRKAGPNEALIVYGGNTEPRVVVGGGLIVWPFINECKRLSLEPISVDVALQDVVTQPGGAATIEGLAQVMVARSDEMIRKAAEHVLDKSESDIKEVALQSIEGHLRSAMRTMTLEGAQEEREQLAQRVAEAASQDLDNMGLTVESFLIRDVRES